MRRARHLAGPLLVGVAAWCAAGSVTLPAQSAAERLLVPAPLWMLVVAIAAAALVPAWRRRPWLTLPALLTTVPWWPMPVPAAALIWAGPLAWAPIGLAAL